MAASHPTKKRRYVSREPLSLFPDTQRWCNGCEKLLPPSDFNRSQGNRDGLDSHCRSCRSAAKKLVYPQQAQAFAIKHLRRTYGLEPEEFQAMVEAQGNKCAICKTDMGSGKGRHVDHDHLTGAVRALLCHYCNVALGAAKDDPIVLRAMAAYLEHHLTDA